MTSCVLACLSSSELDPIGHDLSTVEENGGSLKTSSDRMQCDEHLSIESSSDECSPQITTTQDASGEEEKVTSILPQENSFGLEAAKNLQPRKRGRPPKIKSPSDAQNFQNGTDQSNEQSEPKPIRKRGRPPKLKTAAENNDGLDELDHKASASTPKRGRPATKKISNEQGDNSEISNSYMETDKSTKIPRKRGRPRKIRTPEEIARNNDHNSEDRQRPNLVRKRGRPPKSITALLQPDGIDQTRIQLEMKEHSVEPRKRGRPPKIISSLA